MTANGRTNGLALRVGCLPKMLLLLFFLPLVLLAADVTGQWTLYTVRFGEQADAVRVELKTAGNGAVTGTLNELTLTGTLQGNHLHLFAKRPNGKEWGTLDGTLQGDGAMTGTSRQDDDELQWTGRRVQATASAPQTHTFVPTKFQRNFSA